MVLRHCSIESCEDPAERYLGSCMICAKHMCAGHVRSGLHECPSSDDDPKAYYAAYDAAKTKHLAALLARIDVEALGAVASKARDGVPCRIPALAEQIDPTTQAELVSRQCGGQNCHLDVEFADGVTWIARIRLDDPLLPPPAVQAHIFLSEVATIRFLANTKVPVTRVYVYELGSPENTVGTSYILMEKLSGKPLNWSRATTAQRDRVMEQLADVYLELEKHPIPLTGSLVPSTGPAGTDGDVQVGPFAQMPCFSSLNHSLGPFQTLEAAYTTIIRQQQHMIVNGELVADSASRAGPFYLKHYDDKGDHILVDDEYNITGIIDWEFVSAEAKEFAFSSPCMMWPVAKFYDGSNVLAEDEERFATIFEQRGRGDMAAIVRGGRKWQRYLFFLGGGIPRDMDEFEPLFQGLRESVGGGRRGGPLLSYQDWKKGALDGLVREDTQLQSLMRGDSD